MSDVCQCTIEYFQYFPLFSPDRAMVTQGCEWAGWADVRVQRGVHSQCVPAGRANIATDCRFLGVHRRTEERRPGNTSQGGAGWDSRETWDRWAMQCWIWLGIAERPGTGGQCSAGSGRFSTLTPSSRSSVTFHTFTKRTSHFFIIHFFYKNSL